MLAWRAQQVTTPSMTWITTPLAHKGVCKEYGSKTHCARIWCQTPPCVRSPHFICKPHTQQTDHFSLNKKRQHACTTQVSPDGTRHSMFVLSTVQQKKHIQYHAHKCIQTLKTSDVVPENGLKGLDLVCTDFHYLYIQCTYFKVIEYLQVRSPVAPSHTAFSMRVLLLEQTGLWLKQ